MYSKKSPSPYPFLIRLLLMGAPDIFQYSNFRSFIDDYQKARAKEDKSFNRSHICRLLGIPNTRSFFNDIVKGKKLTQNYVGRFIEIFELNEEESQYFRILVNMNQAETSSEREVYFEQLLGFYQIPQRTLTMDLCHYYNHWYHGAIRAVIETSDFDNDYLWLANKIYPPITAEQARSSVRLLSRLGLVELDEEKVWRVTDKAITSGPDLNKELLVQFHLKSLDLSKEALINNNGMHKQFSTNTISLSNDTYEKLQQRLKKFKSEVRALVDNDEQKADKVYQFNMQLFPVANED